MPNVYDALQPHPNGDLATANPWDDDHNINRSANGNAIIPVSPLPTRLVNANGNGSAPESIVSSTSSSPSPSGKSGLRSRRNGSHRRVSTVDGSVSAHPLQANSPTTPTQTPSGKPTLDGAITRPTLKRLLGTYSECDLDESEQGSSEGDLGVFTEQGSREQEIMVIVHEVVRTDSIAGVALKYGISLADLRRANHLWASDSIHLRKVLYIPLHLSTRKDLFYPMNEHGGALAIGGESAAESSTSARSSVVIQRVPLSQLAFFPPSSQPSLSPDSERKRTRTAFPPVVPTPPRAPTPLRIQSESYGSPSLSALFQALPLPSREILFPRLSLDSSETSSAASSDQEHEMDLLGQSRSRSRKRTLSGGRDRVASYKGKGKAKERNRNSAASVETLRLGRMYDDDSLDTPLVPLQTEQLKPSPQMQLPRALRRDGG